MSDQDKPAMQEFARMRPDVYDSLVKSLGSAATIMVDDRTSALRTSYLLGVQLVLTKLREGYAL